MKLFCAAALISAESVAFGLDCSSYNWWSAQVYRNEPAATVVYDGKLYTQKWYAELTDVPGTNDNGPWALVGNCDILPKPTSPPVSTPTPVGPTTPPTAPPPTNEIDCADYIPWSGSKTYANPGMKVSFNGYAFTSFGWSQGTVPASVEGGPWIAVGKCIAGTIPAAEEEAALTPDMIESLCTCCTGCAKLENGTPQCLTSVDACYFTDCSGHHNYDEAKCQTLIDGGRFYHFTGEITGPMTQTWPSKIYAPYVDMGLYPFPKLSEVAQVIDSKFFNTAFVVTSNRANKTECAGAWAAVIPLEQGPSSWNEAAGQNDYFYDELNKLRALGGDIIVSFGGAANIELADAEVCREGGDPVNAIFEAYDKVVEYMKLTHIDFDIEGTAISTINRATGWAYRFQAVKKLREKRPDLHIWWTLPTLPAGLTLDGQNFIEDMMAAEAPWDLINVMTMDYGDSACPSLQMGDCEREAITNLAQNVYDAAVKTGKASKYGFNSVQDVYPKLGSTPMIGMNDVITETYYPADAEASLALWKSSKPLGMISNWSLARDKPCPAGQGTNAAVADCNSLPTSVEYQFARIFNTYTQY